MSPTLFESMGILEILAWGNCFIIAWTILVQFYYLGYGSGRNFR